MKALTAERLRELLHYDPETGIFRWLVATSSRRRVGEIAGTTDPLGYRVISIDGSGYRANRLAVLYQTGKFPELDVDHIDGATGNDSWLNLREATASENHANSRRHRTNKSGFKGVHWNKQARKFHAQIRVRGCKIYLGLFESAEDGHAAYMAAAIEHYGAFASDGVRAA